MDFFIHYFGGALNETTMHAMLIHFPIVLFFISLTLYIIYFFSNKSVSIWIVLGFFITLLSSSLFARYTGEIAGINVGPTLTNPRALRDHAMNANAFINGLYIQLVLFVIVEFFLINKSILKSKFHRLARGIVICFSLYCTSNLYSTGKTGAILVFKYAAGVEIPKRRAEKVLEEYKLKENSQKNNEGGSQ